jgi:YebC/PmpR family DNA-binding regulatory protein
LGRAIALAAKEGGPDPETNFKLRLAIEKARSVNLPKVNIDRAIERGTGTGGGTGLETVLYEGFGPFQVAVLVEAVTDNKNRTAAEIKKIFERGGGRLGQPGSAAYLFIRKGRLLVAAAADVDQQQLQIIDLGVDGVETVGEGVEVLVPPAALAQYRDQLIQGGFKVLSAELIYKPHDLLTVAPDQENQLTEWLELLESHDDVQAVYTNW